MSYAFFKRRDENFSIMYKIAKVEADKFRIEAIVSMSDSRNAYISCLKDGYLESNLNAFAKDCEQVSKDDFDNMLIQAMSIISDSNKE